MASHSHPSSALFINLIKVNNDIMLTNLKSGCSQFIFLCFRNKCECIKNIQQENDHPCSSVDDQNLEQSKGRFTLVVIYIRYFFSNVFLIKLSNHQQNNKKQSLIIIIQRQQ
ncbi:hypothetical protein ABPG72_003179 [Tetrahymena utriculariae]